MPVRQEIRREFGADTTSFPSTGELLICGGFDSAKLFGEVVLLDPGGIPVGVHNLIGRLLSLAFKLRILPAFVDVGINSVNFAEVPCFPTLAVEMLGSTPPPTMGAVWDSEAVFHL